MQKKCLRCGEPTRPERERCSRCSSVLEGQTPFINNTSKGDPGTGVGLRISLIAVAVAIVVGGYMTFFRASDKPAASIPVAPPPSAAPKKEATVQLNLDAASNSNAAARARMLKEMDDRAKAVANATK